MSGQSDLQTPLPAPALVHVGIAGHGGFATVVAPDDQLARVAAADDPGGSLDDAAIQPGGPHRLAFQRPLGQLTAPAACPPPLPFDRAAVLVLRLHGCPGPDRRDVGVPG